MLSPIFRASRAFYSAVAYRVQVWVLSLHSSAVTPELSPAEILNNNSLVSQPALRVAREISLLRRLLRAAPYWRGGHLLLGEKALCVNDVALAYGAAQASLKLEGNISGSPRARSILGRCYLRRGMPQEAHDVFAQILDELPTDPALQEDFAASLIALEKFSEASVVLQQIPEKLISTEGRTALLYATRRSKEGGHGEGKNTSSH